MRATMTATARSFDPAALAAKRCLTVAEAAFYTGDICRAHFVKHFADCRIALGRRVLYDRRKIDRRIDALSGLADTTGAGAEVEAPIR